MPEVKELKSIRVAGQATTAKEQRYDFFIQWHLTEKCNLKCRHCYQSGRSGAELTLHRIRQVLDEISEMLHDWTTLYGMEFTPGINVTGGEPFLRAGFFEIIEEIRTRGLNIHILSNGTLIDGDKARALARLGVSGVQVSMEGPEPIHDEIRGKGSFASAARGIRYLVEAGIPVTLNATLSQLNISFAPDLVSIASALKVQRLGFSRLVPSGRGLTLSKQMLSKTQVKSIYTLLLSFQSDDLDIVTGDPIASQYFGKSRPDPDDSALGGCAAGISGLTILPDGTVTPCRRLNIPIGNVRLDSLRELWANSEVLLRLRNRDNYKGKCGKCQLWANCRGCRAVAYAWSSLKGNPDFLAEDPQCFIKTARRGGTQPGQPHRKLPERPLRAG